MVKKIFLVCVISVLCINLSFAQVDFNKQYFNAKTLFREGKYNLAMESFKPLTQYDQNNVFTEYASFYYALSAYNLNFKAVSKDAFTQLKTLHPKWEKMDEVNFWLGKIQLENKEYFVGLKTLTLITDKKLQKDVDQVKRNALRDITDLETLRRINIEYPKDEIVATYLAIALSKNTVDPNNLAQLEAIIGTFGFKKSDFIPEAPKTVHKDVYSVSALLPLMVSTLDPSPSMKRNQNVLDMYEGMKLAVDTLSKQGIKLSLRAYDTERSNDKIKTILATEELKNTDLIVGPFFQEENKFIQEFSLNNKINVFNPVSNNAELIAGNPYAFLYQPSFEVIGKKSGEFLAGYAKKKNCIVYYGTSKRDSILAANFNQTASENGLRILSSNRLSRENFGKVLTMLATPTEYDEFHYPKQFTLKKDSLGSIFVASDDALIYAKVLSSIETRKDSVIVLGSEAWLDQAVVDAGKYQTLPVVLASPNFSSSDNAYLKAFTKKFVKTHGRAPTTYAKYGYEFMLFVGHQLKKNGVYFQEGLSATNFIPGYLTEGYNFQFSRDNQLIPFVRFKNGKRVVIEKR
ncbi:MAG TPA: ABC transporter substrate-binding protein [Chryseolinea sp.]|nr:ABC transporter substrate-binding protein [Chryseolinea sp.]HPH47061.1 ABC transporter substrate-binding protein [Chryseolinea sp.]HPM29413.1 ABC transporter substrate-binding protein [Chryseolinea sp.]